MILDKFVKVKIGGRNIKHFKSIYENVKILQELTIPVAQLTEGKH